MAYLLGIDVGTNGTKAVLFNEDGLYLDGAYRGYDLLYPREGWVEQRASDWWDGVVGSVHELLHRNPVADRIAALSLSAQGGSTVLLDDHFLPLQNAVSWLDMRAREIQPLLEKKISSDALYHIGGWNRLYCCNFPVVFWFREKQPTLFERTRYFASTVDYINKRLTGRFVIDQTNLALTEFLDIQRRDWSDKLLDIAGIERNKVPEIMAPGEIIGPIQGEAAEELGLSGDVLVVSGGHDQYCANVGAGAIHHGDCVLSSGTAWVLLVTSDRLFWDNEDIVHPGLHLLPNKFGLMTAISSAGDALNWYKRNFMGEQSFKDLDRGIRKVDAGSEGLIFVPKFTSESKRACFVGIDNVHDRLHFARAVFEGVALACKMHLSALRDIGMEAEKLIMIGGGANSDVWPTIVADATGLPVVVPQQRESACVGAAILAGVGGGVFSSIEEAVGRFEGDSTFIAPDRTHREVYEAAYQRFLSALGHV